MMRNYNILLYLLFNSQKACWIYFKHEDVLSCQIRHDNDRDGKFSFNKRVGCDQFVKLQSSLKKLWEMC
jgi:hypothetical protein